jgi:NosR/NirI family nitrous oxide reductase transcriptional regulator
MFVVRLLLRLLVCVTLSVGTKAETGPFDFLDSVSISTIQKIFPGAETAGPPSGRPAAARVYGEAGLEGFLSTIGYVFSVGDLLKTAGYTGEPFEIISAVDMEGVVTGALLVKHKEPLLRNTSMDPNLEQSVAAFSRLDVLNPRSRNFGTYAGYRDISALIMLEAVYQAGRSVAISRELRGPGEREGRRLNLESYQSFSWEKLLNMGAVRSVTLTDADILASSISDFNSPETELGNSTHIERIYLTLATPALIGRNVLANEEYSNFYSAETSNEFGVLIWLGAEGETISGEIGLALGGNDRARFELQLRQGGWVRSIDNSIAREVVPLVPSIMSGSWLVRVEKEDDFDPTQPWSVEIKAHGDGANNDVLSIPYSPPQEIVLEPIPHQVAVAHRAQETVVPLWVTVWVEQRYALGIMFVSFLALSMILILQGSLVRSPKVLNAIKLGFLLFTLTWLGWYAGAQVSIMHILSLVRAPVLEWSLESLLLDPLVLGVLGFALVGTLLLGRGVFCGWLCPFGALQDLLSQVAKRLHIRQFSFPASVNRRLWSLKYFVLIGLLAVMFVSPNYLYQAVEVEPFNTAILFYFVRSWPYTLFALVVLATSFFVERSFCRYLCPLGAGLAVAGRMRMLEWLKRRPECGNGCNICGDLCTVQAIGADGAINFSECYQCLKCQVAFHDNTVCPPLIQRRERREQLEVI